MILMLGDLVTISWTKDYKSICAEVVPLRVGFIARLSTYGMVRGFAMEAWAGRLGAGMDIYEGVQMGIGAFGYRLQFLSPNAGEQ